MARRDISGAVDFAYLESYAGGDGALVDEVLELFRQQADIWRPMLRASEEGWPDAAHTLKGASRGIGAGALAAACEAAEAAGEDLVLAEVRLDAVQTELDRALADIAAYAHGKALEGLRTP
jgi:HPt (histidine-containing phosphotransfer) domain-containing protein